MRRCPSLLLGGIILVLAPAVTGGGRGLAREGMGDRHPREPGDVGRRARRGGGLRQEHGGGSGCVIRHGYLVKEWGDPKARADIKSATKGSVGATAARPGRRRGAGRARRPGAEALPGARHREARRTAADWLGEITVRHLATMTAGFDDGRPPRLVYRPGTGGIYSNDTANMLAELLTAPVRRGPGAVLKRKVHGPDRGRPARSGAGGTNQLPAQGDRRAEDPRVRLGHHDHPPRPGPDRLPVPARGPVEGPADPLARSSSGRRPGRPTCPPRIPITASTGGATPGGRFAGMPRDIYWALGLGDSFVVVCPSLDIVAVRLGVGLDESQLPAADRRLGAGRSRASSGSSSTRRSSSPYPPSPVIRGLDLGPARRRSSARRRTATTGRSPGPTTTTSTPPTATATGSSRRCPRS